MGLASRPNHHHRFLITMSVLWVLIAILHSSQAVTGTARLKFWIIMIENGCKLKTIHFQIMAGKMNIPFKSLSISKDTKQK